MTLVQVEAYLGPEKPETIAEAVIAIPDGKDHRDYHYAVVRQDYATGNTSVVSLDESEAEALKEVRAYTTHKGFGILCNVRTAPVAELEAEAHSVS